MIKINCDLTNFVRENQLNIVLFEPEIPPNAGNVARLCAATGSSLFLVGKLGFKLEDRHLKRAGLDYWPKVDLYHLESLDELWLKFSRDCFYLVSTKGKISYTKVCYRKGDFLVFGKESAGLPADFLVDNLDRTITIPMPGEIRSLNLSSSAAIVAYEALRQIHGW
ncbi:MAG: tRNA (cytidine(34)-2'-O)-methyltransferase [Candidatus Wallbacteria bacterium]|nr:tRNA (cytidine(34)-2'-O)-methyltransferase [Candidatus Wallbacteria bacterium]